MRQSKLVIVDESSKSKAARKGKPGPSTPQPLRALFSPTAQKASGALPPLGKSESPDSVLSPNIVGGYVCSSLSRVHCCLSSPRRGVLVV